MNILYKLLSFCKLNQTITGSETDAKNKTSGDYITRIANGRNLIDGKPTWEYAQSKKNDLSFMLRCCEIEMAMMQEIDLVAAPYYFERAAILLRKAKNYRREIEICENYITAIDRFYETKDISKYADIRKGSRFKGICQRISKAQLLYK